MIDIKYIATRRRELDLSQDQAAKLAGLGTRHAWNRIENGHNANVKLATVAGIAKALACPVSRLILEPRIVRAHCTTPVKPTKKAKTPKKTSRVHTD